METGGEDQWTTIDRKASKKKSKQEDKPVIDEGWEQVSKKEKRTKKDSVSNTGQKNDKSRNGDRYGGGRGGRGGGGEGGSGVGPRYLATDLDTPFGAALDLSVAEGSFKFQDKLFTFSSGLMHLQQNKSY